MAMPFHQSTFFANCKADSRVNAIVWRNPACTHGTTQRVAFYKSSSARLAIAQRTLGSDTWTVQDSTFTGNNASDTHCAASLVTDGDGESHVCWGTHSTKLRYWKGGDSNDITVDSEELPLVTDAASTVGSGTNGTSTFSSNLTEATNDVYLDGIIAFKTGVLAGQTRTIADYNGTTKAITVDIPFGSAPSEGDEFEIGLYEGNVTYQVFLKLGNGDLLLFFRFGGSGNADYICYHYETATNGGAGWTRRHGIFLLGGGESQYPNKVVRDPATGRIHWSHCNRRTSGFDNYNEYYLYSDDDFETLKNRAGEALTVPISRAHANDKCLIATIADTAGLMNTQGQAWNAAGFGVTSAYWDSLNNGVSQYNDIQWNGAAWAATQCGTETGAFKVVTGMTTFVLSQTLALFDGTNHYRIFRSDTLSAQYGEGIFVRVCTEPTLTTWNTYKLWSGTVDAWAPAMDEELWYGEGELHLYFQRCTEDAGSPMPGSVLEFSDLSLILNEPPLLPANTSTRSSGQPVMPLGRRDGVGGARR
jgi:hypothetical protein